MTDNEWLSLIKTDPQKAHAELIEQYGDLVCAIVLSKLKSTASREEIEDCVSDVFVELFRSSDKFGGQGSIKAYLSTIAKRTAVNAFHKLIRKNKAISYIEESETELPAQADTPDDEFEKKLLKRRLWELVNELGEPDRTIIIYQYVYQLKAKQIAEKLSMKPDAVQKRSIRARERLRKKLGQEAIL